MKPSTPTLLVAQAVSLGLILANLIIPGSAVFLETYGSGRLPFVYLLVAAAGTAVSSMVNRLQSRYGLYQLAVGATLAVAAVAALGWILVAAFDQPWATFVVLTLFAVQLQLGFVFIGAQAGRAFDVQQIKRVFPRIVAGFVVGFMIGGFLARPILALVDRAEHLLAAASLAAVIMAALMFWTGATAPGVDAADEADSGGDSDEKPAMPASSLRSLLGIPLVAAVFAYQVLSAMGTQLVDYLVYDRAAARYSGAEELASFMGGFTAVLNLTDLVVLVLVGGLLMARYGLRFGVGANPVIVTGLVIAAVIVSVVGGTESTTLFVLVGVARVADLTMADVATRTSVNATFQVLPANQRLAAQVGVEGAGVPVALGLTAVLILTINAIWESPVIPVIVATTIVCGLWCALSLVVYRRYRHATVVAARRRMLDDVRVDLSEPATRDALLELARSGTARDVGVAVDLLATENFNEESDPAVAPGITEGAGSGIGPLLLELSDSHDLAVRHAVLRHLIDHHPARALQVAVDCVASLERRLKIDGLRALGRLGGPVAGKHLSEAAGHEDHHIRSVALGALITSDENGSDGSIYGRDHLLEELTAPEREVRIAAAGAVGAMDDRFQAVIFGELTARDHGPAIDEFFRGCSGRSGPATCDEVLRWMAAADPKPAHRAVRFLLSNRFKAPASDETIQAIIDDQVRLAARAAEWSERLGDEAAPRRADPDRALAGDLAVQRLRRAIEAERDAAQKHLIEALGLVYDRELMRRVGHLWSDRVSGDHAMAREALDLTLAPHHRSPVLEALADTPEQAAGSCSLDAVGELAASAAWALEADWLQASAVAVLLEYTEPAVDGLEAMGPISSQLLDSARR